MMDSSFLTWINVGLGLYTGIMFIKFLVQFGLPNHPARFTIYLVCLCTAAYFVMKALAGLGFLSPFFFLKWRPLPLVIGALGFFLQVITTVRSLSIIQQKVISRIPLIGGLLVFAFFPEVTEIFLGVCVLIGGTILSVSVRKSRYQHRTYLKMCLFLVPYGALVFSGNYWAYVFGEVFLFPALFYFFIFQQSLGVSILIEGHQRSREGVVP